MVIDNMIREFVMCQPSIIKFQYSYIKNKLKLSETPIPEK